MLLKLCNQKLVFFPYIVIGVFNKAHIHLATRAKGPSLQDFNAKTTLAQLLHLAFHRDSPLKGIP